MLHFTHLISIIQSDISAKYFSGNCSIYTTTFLFYLLKNLQEEHSIYSDWSVKSLILFVYEKFFSTVMQLNKSCDCTFSNECWGRSGGIKLTEALLRHEAMFRKENPKQTFTLKRFLSRWVTLLIEHSYLHLRLSTLFSEVSVGSSLVWRQSVNQSERSSNLEPIILVTLNWFHLP